MAKKPNRQTRRTATSKKAPPEKRRVAQEIVAAHENPLRGDAKVEVGGGAFIFNITIRTLGALATAWGTRNNSELFTRLQGDLVVVGKHPQTGEELKAPGGPNIADLPVIVEALSGGALKAEVVESFGMGDLQRCMQGIANACFRSNPEFDPSKKAAAADEATSAT